MKKIMTKISDWCEDLIWRLTHAKYATKNFIICLKRWISYRKILFNIYDFDYTSSLEVERFQLIRLKNDISKNRNHASWERDVRNINLAIKLLDIILEAGRAELVGSSFSFSEDGKLLHNDESFWTLDVYVNTKNANRFMSKRALEMLDDHCIKVIMKDELRLEKAWHLYHKLRVYTMREWWD